MKLNILIILVLTFSVFGQETSQIKIGQPAPQIEINILSLAEPTSVVKIESFKNKILVLEFWATWCAPCIPAIDHLNHLAEEFKDKPVQFISVTNEDPVRISRFLKSKPIKGIVALDPDNLVFKAFRVVGVPHTVIIDQSGRIAAITSPKNLNAVVINDLLAGKTLSLPAKKNIPPDLEWDKATISDGIEPLFQAIIKPANTGRGGMIVKPNRITADGVSLMAAVVQAYKTPIFRIFFNFPEPKGNYRISVIVPQDKEDLLNPVFQKALEMTFEMKVRRELREMDVYVMKVAGGKAPFLKPSAARESVTGFGEGLIRSQKQPISKLAADLEIFLEKPIINETGLKQEYDWEIPYVWASPEPLINEVKERLGIELIKTRRPVEILIFEKER